MPPPRPLTNRLLSPLRRTPQYAPHLKPRRAYHPSTAAVESTSRVTCHLLRAHPSPQPHCQRQSPRRPYSTSPLSPEPKHYTFEEVRNLSSKPSPKRMIIGLYNPNTPHPHSLSPIFASKTSITQILQPVPTKLTNQTSANPPNSTKQAASPAPIPCL